MELIFYKRLSNKEEFLNLIEDLEIALEGPTQKHYYTFGDRHYVEIYEEDGIHNFEIEYVMEDNIYIIVDIYEN